MEFKTQRIVSFYTKIILKKKKKFFLPRRKNVNWFIKEKEKINFKKPTITNFVYSFINENSLIKEKLVNQIALTFNYENLILTEKNYFLKNNLNIYLNYCYIFLKNNNNFNASSNLFFNNNWCILSKPKKNYFFTFYTNSTKLIFSCGVIRLVMLLVDKCSKKKKIVFLNSVKFLWNYKKINYKKINFKFNGCFSVVKDVFQKYKEESNDIKIILLNPKLNFGLQNLKKRASIKKKLRKKKQIINN